MSFSNTIAILIGGLLIPVLAWRFVGPFRHRDPLLLPLLIVAGSFTAGGLGAWYQAPRTLDWTLVIGIVGLVAVAVRWRKARVAMSAPDAKR